MKLEKKDIEHIANLARLELTEAEMEKYGQQLSAVLGYVEQLKEVDTEGVEATAQVTGLTNVLRPDEKDAWNDAERQAAINCSPELEDGQVKVGRVL